MLANGGGIWYELMVPWTHKESSISGRGRLHPGGRRLMKQTFGPILQPRFTFLGRHADRVTRCTMHNVGLRDNPIERGISRDLELYLCRILSDLIVARMR